MQVVMVVQSGRLYWWCSQAGSNGGVVRQVVMVVQSGR